MALLSKSSRKLILYFCHLNLFRKAGQTCNGRNWLITKFIPSNILCVRVRSNRHSNHVRSNQDHHSTARDRLQLQQRAQPQRTSSYVPKHILQDHSHSDQVRIHSVRVHRSIQFHSKAMGQLQHQQKEQRQQWAQHQLPSSCVPKGIYLQDHSRSVRVHSIHGLVLRSNHHSTARGQHLGQQQQ